MEKDSKEIILEEAKRIADRYLDGISHCAEYPDAFWFSNKNTALSFGGENSPVIILKASGKAVDAVTYTAGGTGEIIREYDWNK